MSKLSPAAGHESSLEDGGKYSRLLAFLPYLLILILTLAGIAYSGINKKPLIIYWEILAVITGLVCIVAGWPRATTRSAQVRLLWTQGLHWAAFLGVMLIFLHTDVTQMLNSDARGLVVLLLLALGTFVAGVHTVSWQTCVLGAVMALSVPAVAWIEESALLLVFSAALLVVIGALFWWFRRSHGAPGPRPV